jgi:hypothetical protein
MSHLPHSDRVIIDLRKIEDYCLNPEHPRGRHKARLFLEALGIRRTDAPWLREVLLGAVRDSEAIELARMLLETAGVSIYLSRDGENVLW